MTREILFKAKRKDNGEWAEGGAMTDSKRLSCKDCRFFIHKEYGDRGGIKGKCRIRRPNEVRVGSRTACRMFMQKEVEE